MAYQMVCDGCGLLVKPRAVLRVVKSQLMVVTEDLALREPLDCDEVAQWEYCEACWDIMLAVLEDPDVSGKTAVEVEKVNHIEKVKRQHEYGEWGEEGQ